MIKDAKILHIIVDDKFSDSAYLAFEKVAPNCNVFIVSGGKRKLEHIKLIPVKFVNSFAYLNPLFLRSLKKYDFVVLHSLTKFNQELVARINKNVKLVWIGMGYDYYDLIYNDKNKLFKSKTQKVVNKLEKKKNKPRKHFINRIMEKFAYKNIPKHAILKKISYFAPVLENEFNAVVANFDKKRFPKYIDWNYGIVEGFLRTNSDISIHANNILIGNSAASTNNHIEVFDTLKKLELNNRKIICPLSYGDKLYGDYIENTGKNMFEDSFIPVRNFMQKKDYFNLISSCSHVIMNHIRQQAGGNIRMMIFLGAKVFLDSRNPFFDYYKKMGIRIYSIEEINSQSINKPLDKKSIEKNKSILQKEMKEKKYFIKTEKLIKELLNRK